MNTNTVYCVKAALSSSALFKRNGNFKVYHHGGFQQQSHQHLVNLYLYQYGGIRVTASAAVEAYVTVILFSFIAKTLQ